MNKGHYSSFHCSFSLDTKQLPACHIMNQMFFLKRFKIPPLFLSCAYLYVCTCIQLAIFLCWHCGVPTIPHKLETDCYVLMLVLWSSSGTHIDVRLTATFLCWHHAALTVPTLGFRLLLHLYAGTMQLQQYPQRLETDCYILMLTLCNSNGIHIDFSLTATSLY